MTKIKDCRTKRTKGSTGVAGSGGSIITMSVGTGLDITNSKVLGPPT